MKRVYKPLLMALLCVFLLRLPLPAAHAADGVPKIDAVLVLDASNSMRTSDPARISVEAMKMFIDMLNVSGDKVGIVSYSDQIERAKAMTAIRGAQDKQALKDFISTLQLGVYTDITLGLDEAIRMMDDARDPSHKPMIIMLTDGNNELPPDSAKTLDDCERETERIIGEALAKGYPIYTIGLNYNGYLNREYIENIAESTGALCFEAKTADELPGILTAIFANQMEIVAVYEEVNADGGFQTVYMDIPDPNIVEANITLLSGQPVEIELIAPGGTPTALNSNNVVFSQSATYALVKILAPEQGRWRLNVKGVDGDKIKIYLLYNYFIDIEMNITGSLIEQENAQIRVTLLESGAPAQNASLYENSACVISVSALNASIPPQEYAAVYRNGAFETDIAFPAAGGYTVAAYVEHSNFFREISETVQVAGSASTPPVSTPPPTPSPSAPPAPTTPAPTPVPVSEPEPSLPLPLIIGGAAAALVLAAALYIVLRALKKSSRVFTGKMVIDVTDNYTRERMAPQYRNLIEYGRRADLLSLLNGAVSPSLSGVILTPSPNAPSHMPKLLIKCSNPAIKFKRDFMELDASKGIEMNIKSDLNVVLEAENKHIRLRYTE